MAIVHSCPSGQQRAIAETLAKHLFRGKTMAKHLNIITNKFHK